jgi:hypothetical protein
METGTRQRGSWWHPLDYYNIASLQTEISAIFRGMFGIFRGMSMLLFIYSMISRGTPNDILRIPRIS